MLTLERASYDLIARIQAGDPDAFGELYERYRGTVYAFALRRLRQREAAEDITQEVFVRALKAVGRFQTIGSVGGWLTMIARNLVADRFGSKAYRVEVLTAEFYGQDSPDRRRDANPEEATLAALSRVDVLAAMPLLTDSQRRVLVLRYWRGMSTAELAVAMGRDEGAVKALLWRARRAMARLLAEVPDA